MAGLLRRWLLCMWLTVTSSMPNDSLQIASLSRFGGLLPALDAPAPSTRSVCGG